MVTADAASASVRFVLLRSLPMVVVDLEAPDTQTPVLLDGGLFQTLVERGLAVLPRFYGLDLPKGARVGFTLGHDELRLEDEQETTLLRVPRGAVDPAWLAAAMRLKGTMVLVARDLGLDPDLSEKSLCDLLETATGEERVAGAIVGVAEPRDTLPLISLT